MCLLPSEDSVYLHFARPPNPVMRKALGNNLDNRIQRNLDGRILGDQFIVKLPYRVRHTRVTLPPTRDGDNRAAVEWVTAGLALSLQYCLILLGAVSDDHLICLVVRDGTMAPRPGVFGPRTSVLQRSAVLRFRRRRDERRQPSAHASASRTADHARYTLSSSPIQNTSRLAVL